MFIHVVYSIRCLLTGSLFDEEGRLFAWWTNTSRASYMARAKTIVEQYSQYSTSAGNLNGNLTSGENIADNGGVKEAYMVGWNVLWLTFGTIPSICSSKVNILSFHGIVGVLQAFKQYMKRLNDTMPPVLPGLENFSVEKVYFLASAQVSWRLTRVPTVKKGKKQTWILEQNKKLIKNFAHKIDRLNMTNKGYKAEFGFVSDVVWILSTRVLEQQHSPVGPQSLPFPCYGSAVQLTRVRRSLRMSSRLFNESSTPCRRLVMPLRTKHCIIVTLNDCRQYRVDTVWSLASCISLNLTLVFIIIFYCFTLHMVFGTLFLRSAGLDLRNLCVTSCFMAGKPCIFRHSWCLRLSVRHWYQLCHSGTLPVFGLRIFWKTLVQLRVNVVPLIRQIYILFLLFSTFITVVHYIKSWLYSIQISSYSKKIQA